MQERTEGLEWAQEGVAGQLPITEAATLILMMVMTTQGQLGGLEEPVLEVPREREVLAGT